MLFNSFPFVYFFVGVYLVYLVLERRWQNGLLLIASYFFYGCWDPRFLLLIGLSTLVDYFCGLAIGRSESVRWKKIALIVSLATNLGFLGFFKYFNFFIDNANDALSYLGVDSSRLHLE